MKYAPPNAEGLKPWVATIREWGKTRDRIVYADTSAEARWQAAGGMRYVSATVRRATPADVEALVGS